MKKIKNSQPQTKFTGSCKKRGYSKKKKKKKKGKGKRSIQLY